MRDLKPLTDAEITELLGWVSACQSSYHIDRTPGHRFGGLGSHLQENRDSLVKYVNALIAARAQPAQAVPVLTEREIEDMYEAVKGKGWSLDFARAVEQAVRAKMGVAVPMTDAQINDAYGEARVQHDHIPHDDVARIARSVEKHHGIVGKEGA